MYASGIWGVVHLEKIIISIYVIIDSVEQAC